METQTHPAASLEEAITRFNGAPEVDATWVAAHRGELRLVDVREPHELTGPLGRVEGAQNVPLADLLARGLDADRSESVVFICRSGRRSAQAAEALARFGFDSVGSVEGGMLAWNAQVEGRTTIYEDEKHENAANLADAIDRTNGLPEVSATWVAQNLGRVRLVDVRQAHERTGPMGLILQAEHIPLGELMAEVQDWPRDQPVVIHCASGGRSARAALAMLDAGFTSVASMEGGMMAWRSYGLP